MNPTLNELLDSKIYVKNNVSFMPAKDLINNFLESIKYDNQPITIKSQNEVMNENLEGGANVAYPRFSIEVDRLNSPITDESNVMGMLVAMDQQKPLVKIYSGMNARACLNLSIFNANNVFAGDLMSNLSNVWNKAQQYFETEEDKFIKHNEVLKKLTETTLNIKQVDHLLGNLLRRASRTTLGTTPIVGAANLLNDRKSIYYFDPKGETTLNNFYNSVTQGITNSKDIFSKPNKTLIAADLLQLLN